MEERSYNRDATISADGVTVHQLYTEEEFEVPAVVLKLVSYRGERCRVRLTVPNLDAARIGFHPDFAGESWTVRDGSLAFETELDPETELTTLYLIESADETVAAQALDDCQIAAVTPLSSSDEQAASESSADDVIEQAESLSESGFEPVDDDEAIDTEATEFGSDPDDILVDPDEEPLSATETTTDDVVTDDGESVDGESVDSTAGPIAFEDGEDPLAEGPSDDPLVQGDDTEPTATEPEPAETQTTESTRTDTTQETEMTPNEQEKPDVSSLATDELVAELQSRLDDGEVTADQRRQLDAELGDESAHDARITHLQSRMSDIEAFSSSMEAVLDEHGDPAEVFGEFEDRLEAMEAEVAEMSDQVDTTAQWRETVEPRLDAVEQNVDEMDDDVAGMERSVEELESEVSAIQSWREKVTGALKTFMDD